MAQNGDSESLAVLLDPGNASALCARDFRRDREARRGQRAAHLRRLLDQLSLGLGRRDIL